MRCVREYWGLAGRAALLGVSLSAAAVGPAIAFPVADFGGLEAASQYNALIFGDVRDYSNSGVDQTDIEGRLAVGGSVYSTSGTPSLTVGYKLSAFGLDSDALALVVAGNFADRNNTIFGSAIIGGDADIGGGDIAGFSVNGSLTVGGDLTFNASNGGGQIGQFRSPDASGPTVTTGGNATFGNGSNVFGEIRSGGDIVVNGDGLGDTTKLVAGGSVIHNNGVAYLETDGRAVNGAGPVAPLVLPLDFTAIEAALKDDSSALAALGASGSARLTTGADVGNGAGDNHGGVVLDGRGLAAGLGPIVFDLDLGPASDIAASIWKNGFSVLSDGAPIVVNVPGQSHTITNFAFFLAGLTADDILFNFFEATSLTLGAADNSSGIGFFGHILAPLADVAFYNGVLNGNLFARSLTGNGQINLVGLPTTAVPEPSLLIVMALLTLALIARRRSTIRV